MLSKSKIQPYLWPVKDSNGRYPIYMKIVVNRNRRYIATGHSIDKDYWDAKNLTVKNAHPDQQTINSDLLTAKMALNKKLRESAVNDDSFSAKKIKEQVTQKDKSGNVFDFLESYLDQLRIKRSEGTMKIYDRYLGVLLEFNGSRELSFTDVDRTFLLKFEKFLIKRFGSKNSIESVWHVIAGWFNVAVKQQLITYKAFDEHEAPKGEVVDKEYLTFDEIDLIERYADNENNPYKVRQAAVWILFGCFTGLRMSDWELFDYKRQVVGKEIRIRAKKNKENVSIPIYPRLKRNLERMKELPLTEPPRALNWQLERLVRFTKLNKHLSTHCGRKTFAVTLCSTLGIDLKTCADIMGITVAICEKNYYRVTNQKIHKEVMQVWGDL